MIPHRIELINFGAIPSADIDLSGVDFAAVIGRNGAGKSTAFTAAPLWNLFGEGRTSSADDVIRAGESDCSVSFTFEHQGGMYRVIRTRSNAGRGKSGLELQKMTESENFQSLSGTTVRETQEKIERLLNLDAETFTSTAMIMQGKANEFTAKAPGQRKAILGQILGLDVYERLQEGAKKRAQAVEKRIDSATENIRSIHERLQTSDGLAEKMAETEAGIVAESEKAEKMSGELRATEEAVAAAIREKESVAEKKRAAEDLRAREQETAEIARRIAYEITVVSDKLTCEDELKKHAELNARLKIVYATMEDKRTRQKQLAADFESLEKSMDSARAEKGRINARLMQLNELLAKKPIFEVAAAEYKSLEKEIEADDAKSKAASKISGEILLLQKELASLNSDCKTNDILRRANTEKASRLENSECVNIAGAEKSPCAFLRDAVEAKKQLPALEKEAAELLSKKNRVADSIAEKNQELTILDYSPVNAEARKERAKALYNAVNTLAEFSAKEELSTSLADQVFSLDMRVSGDEAKKDAMSLEICDLAAALSDFESLESQIAETEKAVAALAEIPALRERKSALLEKQGELAHQLAVVKEEIETIEEWIALHLLDTAKIDEYEQNISLLTAMLMNTKQFLGDLQMRLGALKKTHDEMLALQESLRNLEAERAPLAKQLVEWQTLDRAFSRKGIPALIIENAVPELERISNEILGQMSGGEHSLRFETQRELKSRDGMAETLDIIVSDWQGERPYETFSGGEGSRIDMAIRIAISELLANRAGSRIEWLTMDETFSNQDTEHKELVMDAIKQVSGRFQKVLVITHDESLVGAFPQVINLSRDDSRLLVEVR
jgi:exonuclease SbcC